MGEIYWTPMKFTSLFIMGFLIIMDLFFFILVYNGAIYFINDALPAIRYAGYGLIAMWVGLTVFTILFYLTRRELLWNSLVLLYKRNKINFSEICDNIETFLKNKGIKYSWAKNAGEEFFLFRPVKEIIFPDYTAKIFIFTEKLYLYCKDTKKRDKVRDVVDTFIEDLRARKICPRDIF